MMVADIRKTDPHFQCEMISLQTSRGYEYSALLIHAWLQQRPSMQPSALSIVFLFSFSAAQNVPLLSLVVVS